MKKRENVSLLASEFNVGYKKPEGYFLFNTLRGNFIRFPQTFVNQINWLADNRQKIRNYNSNGIDSRIADLPYELMQTLKEAGFIVPSEFDEVGYLRFRNKTARFSAHTLSLTILPTTNCNMRCIYCYEGLKKGVMPLRVEKELIKFIKYQISSGVKAISTTWYGGEPLLRYNQICNLSKKIISLSKKDKIDYDSSIITNGVLLTRDRAKVLKKLCVKFAQITLDGPPEVHDTRRPLARGGSFNKILDNVCDVCDLLNISLRCNVDRKNIDSAKQLVDILVDRNLEKKVHLYFAPVHDSLNTESAVCKNYGKGCNAIYSFEEFAQIEIELSKYAESKGFKIDDPPMRRFNACAADSLNSFVVEPDGSLQKCWEHVGQKDERVGTLKTGVELNKKALKWYNYDPFLIRMCGKCKLMPICMGWCPVRLLVNQTKDSCQTMKFNLNSQLDKYYQSGSWKNKAERQKRR